MFGFFPTTESAKRIRFAFLTDVEGRVNCCSQRATVDSDVKCWGVVGCSYSAGRVSALVGSVKACSFIGCIRGADRVVGLCVVDDFDTSTK